MTKPPHIAAHSHSSHHRSEIIHSEKCGCFYCLAIFRPSEIKDWVDKWDKDGIEINEGGQTALCPKCGIDSVIGSKSGYPISTEFLETMHTQWF